jgi:hypothetical protein
MEEDLCRGEQVEWLERGRRLLEVHSNRGHIILDSNVVSRRVRVAVRPPQRGDGLSLQPPLGPTRRKTRERLIWSDVAPD